MNGKYYVLYDILNDYSAERVSGKSEFGDLEHAKKRAIKDNNGGGLKWRVDSRYRFQGKPAKAWKGFNTHGELINLIVEAPKKKEAKRRGLAERKTKLLTNKQLEKLFETTAFDRPKTKAMRNFLKKEAPHRVTGLSIEPDGVFIYTESIKWSDDAGAGTWREDTETKAIKDFYSSVQAARGSNPVKSASLGIAPKGRFSKKHLDTLRREYATIGTIDPALSSYKNLTAALDKLSQAQLKQLKNAKIKWLSGLALNRIKIKGNPVSKKHTRLTKKKRSKKQLANDKRLGRMAKERAAKKRGKNPCGTKKKTARKNPVRIQTTKRRRALKKRYVIAALIHVSGGRSLRFYDGEKFAPIGKHVEYATKTLATKIANGLGRSVAVAPTTTTTKKLIDVLSGKA